MDGHAERCEGRNYTCCTCGYEEAQAAEIKRLRAALDALDAKIKERRAIYVKKRQQAKAILIETDTPSDRYQFAVEVLDILLTEVCPEARAALGETE